MIRSREINLRASALIHWFPIQTCCVQSTLVITMQCWNRKTSWRAFKSIHFEYAMNKDFFWLGEFTTTSTIESCYQNFSSSMRKEWKWSNVIALWWTPHRMYCSRIPSCQVEKWEIVPFMLLVSTVSNAQATFVHQRNA